MDLRREDTNPNLKEFQVDSSWIPSTPAKPNSVKQQLICTQENQPVQCLESERPNHVNIAEPTITLPVSSVCTSEVINTRQTGEAADSSSFDIYTETLNSFDTWKPSESASSCVYGEYLHTNDMGKWNKMSFGDLLAEVHKAGNSTVENTMSFGNSFVANHDTMPNIPKDGSSIPSRTFSDLNLPTRKIKNAPTSKNLSPQFEPITPEKTSKTENRQENAVKNLSTDGITRTNDAQESTITELCATINTQLQENVNAVKGGTEEADLSKTPQQKPRRKKHRPKVVKVVGQAKSISTPSSEKHSDPQETIRTKRKYVRRKEISNTTSSTLEGKTEEDDGDSNKNASKFKATLVGKRKYERKQGFNKLEAIMDKGTTETEEIENLRHTRSSCRRSLNFNSEDQARDENSSHCPSSNYVAESTPDNFNVKDQARTTKESITDKRTTETTEIDNLQHTRSSCRRSLNFNLEDQARDENSSHCPSSNCVAESTPDNFNVKDKARTTQECIQGVEFPCSTYQEVKDCLLKSKRHSPSPLAPTKIDPLLDNYPLTDQSVCTKGKCQIVFSDVTHDKESNKVDYHSLRPPKSPNDSNCTNSCLTTEIQNRGLKRNMCTTTEAEICSTNATGTLYNSMQTYLSIFSQNGDKNDCIPEMHFPTVFKKNKTDKGYYTDTSRMQYSVTTSSRHMKHERHTPNDFSTQLFTSSSNQGSVVAQSYATNLLMSRSVPDGTQNGRKIFESLLALGPGTRIKKRISKGPAQVEVSRGEAAKPSRTGHEILHEFNKCMEALATETCSTMPTKKGSKRSLPLKSTGQDCNANGFAIKPMGPPLAITWGSMYVIDSIIDQLNQLDLNAESRQVSAHTQNGFPSCHMHNQKQCALIPYQRGGAVVPFDDSFQVKIKQPRPKVDLDDETTRVWNLLLENINNVGIDGTDEEKAKWWEEERKVFTGRAESFIARMHLVQGDRRFSPWKGSVVDSVVGVFLTQNVSDHLSSSAFMSLAARFPLKSMTNLAEIHEVSISTKMEEPEVCATDLDKTTGSNKKVLYEPVFGEHDEIRVVIGGGGDTDDTISFQTSVVSSQNSADSALAETFGNELCATEISELSVESESETTFQKFTTINSEEGPNTFGRNAHSSKNDNVEINLKVENQRGQVPRHNLFQDNSYKMQETQNVHTSPQNLMDVAVSSSNSDYSRKNEHSQVGSNTNDHGKRDGPKSKEGRIKKEKHIAAAWDGLRKKAQEGGKKRERTTNTMDTVDWGAVRSADVKDIAQTIKDRGMNNKLAERIQDFLNRIVRDHGSIDLEWLRDVPPDKAKEYLLSIRGLGLKSVECVRLLTLHHLAFPVDTNVGRIAVRLGWVPLQPLPESLQLHLLELYPVLESIQKYLWPRLCKLDQRTLYELHYQMITFGKVFCTKSKPNCNACPMKGECRHFASAFASARLALPATEEKGTGDAAENKAASENSLRNVNTLQLPSSQGNHMDVQVSNSQPIIEEPATPEPIIEVPNTPEPEHTQVLEFDIEDTLYEDPDEIPTIELNMEQFTQNLKKVMQQNTELQECFTSKALVALTAEAASIPVPKLKNINRLRTEHQVYELPDSHPLLEGMDKREADDPCPYLLAIWTPGETVDSIQPAERRCSSHETKKLCTDETCLSCNSIRELNSQTVRGTLLIPCRTAMRGSFPLNGTYFQVNEVFSDHESSLNPLNVPREWLWNLPRRTVYFGTTIPTIFKGLTTEGIQYCFWRGFVCVRGFDRTTRAPRPLIARLHFPASKLARGKGKTG